MKDETLAGQVAVVTGAANGLGTAIARLLAAHGAVVHALDIDGAAMRRTAGALPGAVHAHEADITREADILRARNAVLAASGGRVDILVNNAGIYPFEGIDAITEAGWARMFDTNVKSVFFVTRAFAQPMKERRYGRIVSVSSTDSYIPKPLYPHYAASKAAVRSLVKTFALDLAPHGVLCNGVSPGSIATDRAKAEGWLPRATQRIPIGRAAEPDDIAEVILFLASPRNAFMTGETVVASGGEIMV